MKFKRKLIKASLQNLRWRGIAYFGYLLRGYFMPRVGYWLMYRIPRPLLIVNAFVLMGLIVAMPIEQWTNACGNCYRTGFIGTLFPLPVLHAPWLRDFGVDAMGFVLVSGLLLLLARQLRRREMQTMKRWARMLTPETLESAPQLFTRWSQLPISPATRAAVEAEQSAQPGSPIVIGTFDSRGHVYGRFGKLPYMENTIDEPEIEAQDKKELIVSNDRVLVRKTFRDRQRFLHEWCRLATLSGKANVPALARVDEEQRCLEVNYIPGPSLLQARGSEELLTQVEEQLDIIHANRVVKIGLTPPSIVINAETGVPWFVDMSKAEHFNTTSARGLAYKRNQDRIHLNEIYGRDLITEESARFRLGAYDDWGYAPLDFGGGLAVGSFWMVNSGTGRWEFLNKKVMPSVAGMRILDLGSNNGSMPMMMLRAGAKQVVGLELRQRNVAKARLIESIYEWRDMRRYDMQIIQANMLEVLHQDFGKFDMVTAFCSLYYVSEEDMARIIRKAAELAPIIIVQANDKDGSKKTAAGMRRKKSVAFLETILKENGFPYVQISAPPRYSRPLLVARREPINQTESINYSMQPAFRSQTLAGQTQAH